MKYQKNPIDTAHFQFTELHGLVEEKEPRQINPCLWGP